MKRGRRSALLDRPAALILLMLAVSIARAQGFPSVDSCISRLDPQVDIGYDRIAARCPELVRQLEQRGWSAWLPRGWKEAGNDLSAGSLRELRDLAGRETTATPSQRTPDTGRLNAILGKGRDTGARHESWWSRFRTWLRSILQSREQPAEDSWFARMVAHVGFSQSVIELVTYAALAAVVVLAGLIVLYELQTAGLLPKRGVSDRGPRDARMARVSGGGWSDIEAASFADKPRLLLALILVRLSERGYLPPSGALTVRELSRAAQLPDAEDRARLAALALVAERVRFAKPGILAEGLEEPLARGRELLDRLDASPFR